MFCPGCGIQLPDEAAFCLKCGRSMSVAPNAPVLPGGAVEARPLSEQPRYTPSENRERRRSFRSWRVSQTPLQKVFRTIALLFVAVVVTGLLLNYYGFPIGDKNALPATPVALPNPLPHHQLTHLFTDVIEVEPRHVMRNCFEVKPEMKNVWVRGHFVASGGTGNDIQAVVGTEDDYTNWVNGHGGILLFDSGKVTTGQINVSISVPGRYCLAFGNGFALFSPKSVTADVDLDYYSP